MRLVAFLATASRRAASGNNDRLSTPWREMISLAGRCKVNLQSMARPTRAPRWKIEKAGGRYAKQRRNRNRHAMDTLTLRPGGTLSQQGMICGAPSVLVFHFTDIAQDLSDFVADPEDLYFVLLNLCRNASAALRGEVVILAKNSVPVREASTKVVEIIVADNGSGIVDEVLRRAFDSNFTTKPVRQGSGLGLGQVQRFVQESRGAIEIKSEVGVGTAVRNNDAACIETGRR
jgi:signal transduction histidine kinase